MTVEEVKSLLPGCELVEFNPKFRYLVLIDPEAIKMSIAVSCLRRMNEEGIWCALLFTPDPVNSVRVLEFKDEPKL